MSGPLNGDSSGGGGEYACVGGGVGGVVVARPRHDHEPDHERDHEQHHEEQCTSAPADPDNHVTVASGAITGRQTYSAS